MSYEEMAIWPTLACAFYAALKYSSPAGYFEYQEPGKFNVDNKALLVVISTLLAAALMIRLLVLHGG